MTTSHEETAAFRDFLTRQVEERMGILLQRRSGGSDADKKKEWTKVLQLARRTHPKCIGDDATWETIRERWRSIEKATTVSLLLRATYAS